MPLNLPPPKASGSSTTAPSSTSGSRSLSLPAVNGSNGHVQHSEEEVAYSGAAAPSTSASATPSSSSFSSKLGLPPPKTKSKLAAASQPKKFVLDLPKTTRSASELEDDNEQTNGGTDEPAAKKPRVAVGLGALLPEPKKPAAGLGGLKLPEPKSAPLLKESSKPSTSMIPHTLKGKSKPVVKAAETQQETPTEKADQDDQDGEPADSAVLDFFGLGPAAAGEDEEDDDEPADEASMDFFGLSTTKPSTATVAKVASGSTASAAKVKVNGAPASAPTTSTFTVAKKVSAAPTTAAPDLASNYYATLPVPTKTDPYPGFYQKSDGSWAPKRPDEWEVWSQAQGWGEDAEAEEQQRKKKEYKMPADFSAEAAEQSVEVRAANLRGPQNDDLKPSKFSEEEQARIEQEKNKAKAKKFSHNARSRHQLTTLVADAQMNRAELEDRISHMKSNKRTGGQKYGF